jgi:hypothetical protein
MKPVSSPYELSPELSAVGKAKVVADLIHCCRDGPTPCIAVEGVLAADISKGQKIIARWKAEHNEIKHWIFEVADLFVGGFHGRFDQSAFPIGSVINFDVKDSVFDVFVIWSIPLEGFV